MSYDKQKKNRIEERVYSVTMTEEELSLFSEFLEQREFENKSKERFDDYLEYTGPMTQVELDRHRDNLKNWGMEDEIDKTEDQNTIYGLEDLAHSYDEKGMPVEAQVALGKIRTSPIYYPLNEIDRPEGRTENGYLHRVDDGKHRMSKKFVIDRNEEAENILDTTRELRFKHSVAENALKNAEKDYKSNPNADSYNEYFDADMKEDFSRQAAERYWEGEAWMNDPTGRDRLNKIADDSKDIINKESDLAKSKYDDKYSSKRLEKFLDKKIDADKAKNIVDRRHEKDTDYLAKDVEKGRNRDNFHISDIGRKWNDTGIVYNEALGRNLNKDAAIAAGVTAGLVGGGIALRKHLKKKKQEKELAEKKYKTSDKKKK